MINDKPIDILLVEDNPADIRLTQEAFKETRIANYLHIARDGVDALAFLQKTGKYTHVPRPDIILLDLNLPRKDGRELLDDIKNDPEYRQIPVVILTTSTTEEDIIHTYDHHANCYITKPSELEHFLNVVKSIENFWLTVVKLPTCET
jgi:CheY-like chemotaxis protein